MVKLKWKWLNSTAMRDASTDKFGALMTWIFVAIPGIVIMLFIEGVILGLANPNLWILIVPIVAATLAIPFVKLMPKMHYLYGLKYDSRQALGWYESLTDKEKAQLPNGWDTLVREKGEEIIRRKRTRHVAGVMLEDAKNLIEVYRQSVRELEVPDHRIELYLDLMSQRTKELNQDIYERAEIERQIASMP